jgi:hypothetical protein
MDTHIGLITDEHEANVGLDMRILTDEKLLGAEINCFSVFSFVHRRTRNVDEKLASIFIVEVICL